MFFFPSHTAPNRFQYAEAGPESASRLCFRGEVPRRDSFVSKRERPHTDENSPPVWPTNGGALWAAVGGMCGFIYRKKHLSGAGAVAKW